MLVSPTLRNGFNTTQWNPACPFHATLNPDLPDEPLVSNSIDAPATPIAAPKDRDPLEKSRSAVDLTKYKSVHDVLEDIHEFTRLKVSSPNELRLLLDEMQRELDEIYANLPPGTRDPVYSAYSVAFKLHDDACRIWGAFAKKESLLADAKARWRETVAINAQKGISNSVLNDEIASFTLVVERGHIPNTLFPSTSRITTGLTDIVQRHPEIAGKFNNYSFMMPHSIAYLFRQSELLTSLLFPGRSIEETPPYGLLDVQPSQRLATCGSPAI
jgi:hypothetical protein